MDANPNQPEDALFMIGPPQNENASLEYPNGARNQAEAQPDRINCPENKVRFRGNAKSDSREPFTFLYPDCNCRPRSLTGSCMPPHPERDAKGLLVAVHRSGIHLRRTRLFADVTLPEGCYSIVEIIPNYSALTIQSTGQTETHFGESL